MAFRLITCLRCGAQEKRGCYGRGASFCSKCFQPRYREAAKAMMTVRRAVLKGSLPPAAHCNCADCGGVASQYEHRDYTRPLDVAPVCRSCNVKRGPAFDSVYRPQAAA